MRKTLLICGVLSAAVYLATDLAAAALYPGYSLTDQAVSELFAIGAPTSWLVTPLFTVSSLLLLAFAAGVWMASGRNGALRLVAAMFAAMALNALALWLFFPMHMRGAERSLTDTMHIVLSANPFVLVCLVGAWIGLGGRFRPWTIVTAIFLVGPAIWAYRFIPAVDANLPTPGMGLAERIAQYAFNIWQASLAILLVRRTTTLRRPTPVEA